MHSRSTMFARLSLLLAAATLLLCAPACIAFTPLSSKATSCAWQLYYHYAAGSAVVPPALEMAFKKPHWVPMELAELAADDVGLTREEFIRTHADVEAYTSCDDEGDDLHECDFFGSYLGPTKWLHLTPAARASMDEAHFVIWKDVWSHPHEAVDLADKVSKECLRYYKEFMLEPRSPPSECPTDRPFVRVKVVEASFGLEGFEDATWEATEELLELPEEIATKNTDGAKTHEHCKAITFVVAAPDLFTDPILAEGGGKASPQAEFEPDGFREFSSTLMDKMAAFSEAEGVPLAESIRLTPFHPLWKSSSVDGGAQGRGRARESFPYPCVAVSTEVEV